MSQPLVIEIKGNSLDDGPGIRSVIFFKGCPLSCVWCHNPESQHVGNEITYDEKTCVHSGACFEQCEVNALSLDNPFFVDRDKCTLCMACTQHCPSGAIKAAAELMSIQQIMEQVLVDKPFYKTSGGGVTLSGGEPTLYIEFLAQLLKALKKENIHTLLETSGFFNFRRFEQELLPYIDTIYFDLKLMNDDDHRQHCGVSNQSILDNFSKLWELSKNNTFEILPRTPLIPGITATGENLTAIAQYLSDLKVPKSRLLSYNPLWHDKTKKIGVKNLLSDKAELQHWMKKEEVQQCEAIFREHGIAVG